MVETEFSKYIMQYLLEFICDNTIFQYKINFSACTSLAILHCQITVNRHNVQYLISLQPWPYGAAIICGSAVAGDCSAAFCRCVCQIIHTRIPTRTLQNTSVRALGRLPRLRWEISAALSDLHRGFRSSSRAFFISERTHRKR